MQTYPYAQGPSQEGDLYLPGSHCPAVVCLLHGGFWRMPHGREQMAAVAQDLARRGYAIWNLGYRRVGEPSGGWPATLEDVGRGLDALVGLRMAGVFLDLSRVVVVGHSAGGHLALLSALRDGAITPQFRAIAVAGLAPVTDLCQTSRLGLGSGAAESFLGGKAEDFPGRYRAASPVARLPLGVPQLILHGDRDEVVPLEMSQAYATRARSAGDEVTLTILKNGEHMDFLDPRSEAYQVLCRWLCDITGQPPR